MDVDETFVCRACLSRDNLHNISETYLVGRTVFSILCECIGVNLESHSAVVRLCNKCQNILVAFFEFKNRVVTHLGHHLKEIKLEEEESLETVDKESETKLLKIMTDTPLKNLKKTPTQNVYHCPICMKQHLNRRMAQKCLLNHIQDNGGLIECHFCNKKYRRNFLVTHIRRVHTRNHNMTFRCDLCDKSYSHENSLVNHKYWIHKKAVGKFSCYICTQVFRQQSRLDDHVRIKHDGNFVHHCALCKKSFVSAESLKTHLETIHVAEHQYSCTYCGKQFAHKSNCITHEKLHTERLTAGYHCTKCDFKTNTPYNLKRHQVVHSDERKHFCSKCGANFRTRDGLRLHDLVHQEKQLACHICDRQFRRSHHVKSHIERVHMKVQVNEK